MTLAEAARLMAKACRSRTHSSLREGCRLMHRNHPSHCGGKNDPFDALRACSCSLNQLISSLLHGQEALDIAIKESKR